MVLVLLATPSLLFYSIFAKTEHYIPWLSEACLVLTYTMSVSLIGIFYYFDRERACNMLFLWIVASCEYILIAVVLY